MNATRAFTKPSSLCDSDLVDGTRRVPTTFKSIFYVGIIYAHPSFNLKIYEFRFVVKYQFKEWKGGRGKMGRVEDGKDGRVEGWKNGRGEGWRGGRWEMGRGEEWKDGRVEGGRWEGWKMGRMEDARWEGWKNGRVEDGRVEGWKMEDGKDGRWEGWKMEENVTTKSINENRNVTRDAAIVSLAVMGSRLLGLAREMAIFYFFKTKIAASAFHLAFRIPNFLRDMFGEGILSKAFITTFIATETEDGEEAAWNLANRIFNLVVIVLIGITVLGIVFAPAIVDILAREDFDEVLDTGEHYGFGTKVELTIYLTQLMFPYLLFVSLAAIAMGLLNSKGKFGIPACASSFFNLSSLVIGISGFYLFQRFGMHPTTGMAVGVFVGGMLQFLIQVPSMYRVGYRYKPLLSFREPRVVEVLKLVGPAILGVAAVPINQLANTWFITSGDEWLAWIQGAYRIMHFPLGIFGVAISTVILPQLAKFANSDSLDEYRNTLSYGLRLMLTVILPASIGLMVLSEPICRLLYERGEFTATDTFATANILFVYAFGLCGFSSLKIVTDGFYAFKDIRAPVIVSLCGVALNICMNYTFIFKGLWLDERAIVFSTVLTVTLNSVVLLFLLRRRIGRIGLSLVIAVASKILFASAVMGLMCWISHGLIEKDWLGTEGIVPRALNVFIPIGVSVLTLAGMYKVLKVSEFDDILNIFKRKFRNQESN